MPACTSAESFPLCVCLDEEKCSSAEGPKGISSNHLDSWAVWATRSAGRSASRTSSGAERVGIRSANGVDPMAIRNERGSPMIAGARGQRQGGRDGSPRGLPPPVLPLIRLRIGNRLAQFHRPQEGAYNRSSAPSVNICPSTQRSPQGGHHASIPNHCPLAAERRAGLSARQFWRTLTVASKESSTLSRIVARQLVGPPAIQEATHELKIPGCPPDRSAW